MITPEFKPAVAQAVFGSKRGQLIPSTFYLGFDNTSGVELSTNRVAVPNTDAMWLSTGTGVENQTPIVAVAEAAWIIGSVSLWTHATGGQRVCTITLDTPLTVDAEDDLSFDAGNFRVDVA